MRSWTRALLMTGITTETSGLELAGGQLSLLFEDLFKRLNTDLRRQVCTQHSTC